MDDVMSSLSSLSATAYYALTFNWNFYKSSFEKQNFSYALCNKKTVGNAIEFDR